MAFGSVARGDVCDARDIDVLVIDNDAEGRMLDRVGAVLDCRSNEACAKPLVYTSEEFALLSVWRESIAGLETRDHEETEESQPN